MIKADKLIFEYQKHDDEGNLIGTHRAIDEVSLDIEAGQFIAILGHNGSGKSTLAKHINAILTPTEGTIWVDGKNTCKEELLWDIRQSAGMVFQNPDNQIIGTVVEEDVGFGPENLGVPTQEIWERVEDSLSAVGMTEYREHSPNKLSGGQKQRVAIAGVVAMRPKCIVLDEPTAMLDPSGRKEVLSTLQKLREQENITIILITHYMEEVVGADRVIVMEQGHIVLQGTPREIFRQAEILKAYRLDVPQVTLLANELNKKGYGIPNDILSREEFVEACLSCRKKDVKMQILHTPTCMADDKEGEPILAIDHLSYFYSQGNAYEKQALSDICLDIYQGEFIGIIGHTGSGKSTLIQHLNGLLKATKGDIFYRGNNIYEEKYPLRQLRSKVGLVFQYPEHQLFEMDVLSDVCFGPKNQGLTQEESMARAVEALQLVGISKDYYQASPFDLSGGEKRRVAIAGVLAMKPEILILDEPTAGLDPKGRDEILSQIANLRNINNMTVILVSHSMEDVANYVDRIVVMNQGSKMFDGEPKEVFSHYKELESIGLAAPQVTYLMQALANRGCPVDTTATTLEEAVETIAKILEK